MQDTTPANATASPAVAHRLDRVVRPRAWALFAANGNYRMWSTEREEVERLAAEAGAPVVPLYDQDSIAAALAEERERLAKVCEGLFSPAHSGYGEGYNEALHDCAAAIRGLPDCGEAGHAEGKCGNAQCLRGA